MRIASWAAAVNEPEAGRYVRTGGSIGWAGSHTSVFPICQTMEDRMSLDSSLGKPTTRDEQRSKMAFVPVGSRRCPTGSNHWELSMDTLGNQFLGIFTDIEQSMRLALGARRNVRFMDMARDYVQVHNLPLACLGSLQTFASLRNAIDHNSHRRLSNRRADP